MSKGKILAAAIAASGAALVPGTAHAQLISPCLVLGSPLPPPCITFDYKKLADIATQNAHELKKIQETVNTIRQAKAATEGIVSQAKQLTSFDLPKIDVAGELGTVIGGVTSQATGRMTKIADDFGKKMFSGTDGVDANGTATRARAAIMVDANTSAFAYAVAAPEQAKEADKRYCKLAKKMQKSADLRTDWAINSEIKLELMNARARQSYLMSEFLKLQAANGVAGGKTGPTIRTALPRIGLAASAIAIKAVVDAVPRDQSGKVGQLQDLLARAQSVMGSLSVVQMTSSIQGTLQGVIDDYTATAQRKAQNLAQLGAGAAQWRSNSGRGSSANTVSATQASLASIDAQLAALRAQPINTLTGAFATRNIDVNAMLQSDVDPRQFIGTWTDPLKVQTTCSMVAGLLSGTLKGTIKGSLNCPSNTSQAPSGSGDQFKFYQAVYDYNDARLEEAWKKVYADEARVKLAETTQMIAEENTKQGEKVTDSAVIAELQEIVANANSLGQQISAGTDDGSKARAAEILTSLNTLVQGGTGLPVVDVTANPAPPAPNPAP